MADRQIGMVAVGGLGNGFLNLCHQRLPSACLPAPSCSCGTTHLAQTGALGTNLKKMKGILYELALAEAGRTSRAPPAGASEEATPSGGGMDEEA